MLWLRMIAILNIWGFDLKKVSVLVEKKKDASSLHQCTSKVVHCMLGQNLLIWPLGQISSNIYTCDAWRTFSVLRQKKGATHNPPQPPTTPLPSLPTLAGRIVTILINQSITMCPYFAVLPTSLPPPLKNCFVYNVVNVMPSTIPTIIIFMGGMKTIHTW